ncbi:MAG: monooxygenase [Leptolyngbya sp. SIO1D8]|nr:monooxygenase [Leptolyngbya sp. SIO1D8]
MSTAVLTRNIRDYLTIANEVSEHLAVDAVEQDAKAGIPFEEIDALKQSGLLRFSIPREYGGIGAIWPQIYEVVRILSNAQGSVGQLYANHAILLSMLEMLGRPGQAEQYYHLTAQQNLFWANALNSRDTRLSIQAKPGGFVLNGTKSFCTGMAAADISIVSCLQDGSNASVLCILSLKQDGIIYNHDWNNMGQRRTVSGSCTFQDVWVEPEDLLGPSVLNGAFVTLKSLLSLLGQTFVYLGIAEGALEAARGYTLHRTRPWPMSDQDSATQEPFILHRYGEMWAELQAAFALAKQVAAAIQTGWEKGTALTSDERGDIAISMAAARAIAIQTGLKITTHIFDVMGARATTNSCGFDRYWRDLRTFSLHDPIDYKFKDIGNWVLNQQYPTPSQYT